ncbi:hypothetical protein DL89DRAFT_308822 [Linderina pennispora]|uniref:Class E vacuolar protein-sorting machinery protein HSE1 n=1 Tax=Linderina pennispora TaxID=61395 RepID=A0A1Y1WIJ0_9FUNG|nr:uncharacterized protein DL89DRAFT_308822 [Linderina pennispora]ORX72924.1 hypothetical protein DL89DRAFT_308822 [Linderina pennispora]
MFRASSPYEELVNKTTSEMLTTENWELIMEVCDRVGTSETNAGECFNAINKRLLHRNANVVLYTMSLIEAMLKNCGQNVKQEVASRAFTTTLTRILNDKTTHESVKQRILGNIQQWAFEFRQDPTLSLMEETYTKLRAQRFVFPSPQKPEKVPKPSELERQKEEDDLQLALALSLSSADKPGLRTNFQTPAAIRGEITRQKTMAASNNAQGVARRSTHVPSAKKIQVKALFDFVPTEPGELGFFKGDVIVVLDPKMCAPRLCATSTITVEVFTEAHNIEALLRMLGSIDPMKDNVSDNEDVQRLYASTLALRPKIVKLIEKTAKRKEELAKFETQFNDVLKLYDDLMKRDSTTQPQQQAQQQPQQMYPQQGFPLQQPAGSAGSTGSRPQSTGQTYSRQQQQQPTTGSTSTADAAGTADAADAVEPAAAAAAAAAHHVPVSAATTSLSYSQPILATQQTPAQQIAASPVQPPAVQQQGVMYAQQGYVASQQPMSSSQQTMYYPQQAAQGHQQVMTSQALPPQQQQQQQQQQQAVQNPQQYQQAVQYQQYQLQQQQPQQQPPAN